MTPVRWGILSTARINEAVIPPLQASPESEVVAVASRAQGRADEYAWQWGIPRAHGSYEALLEDREVEAVYISLPNAAHVEWSIRCLEAGKHVLCEKPLARAPVDVARAFDAADRSGRLLMEAFMWRHHPQTARLIALVESGAIGDVRLIRASFSYLLETEDIRLEPELDGGALMDVGCYCVSGSRVFAGEPLLASAHQVLGPTGVDLRLVGTLVFPGNVVAQVDCGFDLPTRQQLDVIGRDGTLRTMAPWNGDELGIEILRGSGTERVEIDPYDRYRDQVDNFSRAVRGVAPPLLVRADALGQARAIDALYRSAEAGGAAVPVEQEQGWP